jgi:hypothetical protein
MPDPTGYRVGEPQFTNASKVIEFEVEEMGNAHLLDDVGKALNVEPTLDAINLAIRQRFGSDAVAMWLTDEPEVAEKLYGPGEAYEVTVPGDAILGSDLGRDGKLWIWARKPRRVYIKGMGLFESEDGVYFSKVSPEGMAGQKTLPEDPQKDTGMPGIRVRFLKDIPVSTGLTGKKVGPYVYAAEYVLPKELADFHVRMGDAEYVRAETKRPTLHDLFSGATLDVYLEASRTRPLVAAEMNRQAIERWRLRSKATDLGKEIQGEREKHGL